MKRLLVITLSLLVGVAFFSPTPAHADTQADQLAMYDFVGNVGMACVIGLNQNGVAAHQCWNTTGWQTDFYGYWWQNPQDVTVYLYNFSGAYQNTIYPVINVRNNSTNWWCINDSNASGWEC